MTSHAWFTTERGPIQQDPIQADGGDNNLENY